MLSILTTENEDHRIKMQNGEPIKNNFPIVREPNSMASS